MAKSFHRAFAPHAAIFALILGAVLTAEAYTPDPPPEIDIEDTQESGAATLILETNVTGADIYLNKVFIGRTPHKQTGLLPGIHILRFELDGYRPRELVLDLLEKRTYTIKATLIPRTGWLSVSSEPSDAWIYVDGDAVHGFPMEVPVGSHAVRAYRFGYREAYQSVYVPEEGMASAHFTLETAPFTLSELRLRKNSFNPVNVGALGRAEIRFTVTSFGHAEMEIRDASGAIVHSVRLPPFEESQQTVTWNGRDSSGAPLPDGEYSIALRAYPDAASETFPSDDFRREASVRIDSSILVAPRSLSAGVSGLTLYPDPFVDPARTLRFSTAVKPCLAPDGSLDYSSIVLGAQIAVGDSFEIAFQGALDPESAKSGSFGLGAKRSLFRSGLFHSAVYLTAAYSSGSVSEEPSSPPPIRVGLSAALGGVRVHGGAALETEVPSWDEPTPRLGVRVGFSATNGRQSAGLSAAIRTEALDGTFALAEPITVVLEGRSFLSSLPVAIGLSMGADFGSGGWTALRPAVELSLVF